jgi:hypothetical protein
MSRMILENVGQFRQSYRENNSSKITTDFEVTLGHFLTERNDNSASGTSYAALTLATLASCNRDRLTYPGG